MEFANGNLEPEALKKRASALLSSRDLPRNLLGLTLRDQVAFLEKVDQVCRNDFFFAFETFYMLFSKAYSTIDSKNASYITALGNLCSATVRLPASAILSEGLERRGIIAVASEGFTDMWSGDLGHARVVIKSFRTYSTLDLKEAKEVSI